MKTIIIYSGKGGVGKTTTTCNIAKVLSESGKKVFLLDGDINTPSVNSIFKTRNPNKNLMIESLGYDNKGLIFVQSSMVRDYIREAKRKIREFDPEFVLVDTPPSVTDVHINLIQSLKSSGLIMITQPTDISESDVRRTALFFGQRGVNILGIVENMSIDEERDYELDLLGRIPFVNEKIFDAGHDVYKKIVENILDVDEVEMVNEKINRIESKVTIEDVKSLMQNRSRGQNKKEFLYYYNVETWDYVRNELIEMEWNIVGRTDERLNTCTAERVKRLLDVFEYDNESYFMITRAPNAEIHVFPGEIGRASLFMPEKDKFYGVPRIKYQTEKGDLQLFPDEVVPMSMEEIQIYVNEGYSISKDGRYIPTKEHLVMVDNAFGDRVGMRADWELLYDEFVF